MQIFLAPNDESRIRSFAPTRFRKSARQTYNNPRMTSPTSCCSGVSARYQSVGTYIAKCLSRLLIRLAKWLPWKPVGQQAIKQVSQLQENVQKNVPQLILRLGPEGTACGSVLSRKRKPSGKQLFVRPIASPNFAAAFIPLTSAMYSCNGVFHRT